MRCWLAFAVIVPAGACSPDFGALIDGGGTGSETQIPPDAQQCFGSFVRVCFDTIADVPSTPQTLPTAISTDDSPLCHQANDQKTSYCVVAGAGLTLPAGTKLRGYGSKPLVLLSTTSFDLSGEIDVSSTSDPLVQQPAGAGSNPSGAGLCSVGTAAAGNSGGGGGSFGGRGGDGEGKEGMQGAAAAELGSFPATLRGGCPGGNGSTTTVGFSGGAGGRGGGAVSVIANSIQLSGRINASGAGGLGGPPIKSGGGGGGSGGMIVLDAASIVGAGILFANGGGGGQGGTDPTDPRTGAGATGKESTGPTIVGMGGSAETNGGLGGSGSVGNRLTGLNAGGGSSGGGGGGAGGGAAGFIRAPGVTSVMMAPPAK